MLSKDFSLMFYLFLLVYVLLDYTAGVNESVTLIAQVTLCVFLYYWSKTQAIASTIGLIRPRYSELGFHDFLFLISIISFNLWNGMNFKINYISIPIMCCVAYIEEFLFRGVLYSNFSNLNDALAVVISSLAFGMIHALSMLLSSGNIPLLQIFAIIALAILLAILRQKTNSIIPGIIIHAAFNILAICSKSRPSQMQYLALILLTFTYVAYLQSLILRDSK